MFRNEVCIHIVCAIHFLICPILLWMLMRRVSLDHRLIFVVVMSLAPCSFRDMPPLLWESGLLLGPGWFRYGEVWGQRQRNKWRLWYLLAWNWQKDPCLLPCTHRYTVLCCHRWWGCGESDVIGPCEDRGPRQRTRGVWFVPCNRSSDFWF